MADLPSSFLKVNDVEVSQDAPVTESIFSKLGSNDNYLKDNLDAEITNRTNADNVLQGNINTTNTNLATLTGRVNNAKNITVASYSHFTGGSGGSPFSGGIPAQFYVRVDGGTGNYEIWRSTAISGPGAAGTRQADTGIPITGTQYVTVTWGATSVQFRMDVFVWTITSV